MTDQRLVKRDPTGKNRSEVARSRVDYIDCVKCGKVMREDKFLDHMRTKHA